MHIAYDEFHKSDTKKKKKTQSMLEESYFK